jgi:seryl-tRNA synthetase
MLDIKFIRENLEIVKQSMINRRKEPADFDALIALADERVALKRSIDEINRKRNEAAAARDIEAGKRLKDELQSAEATLGETEKAYLKILITIPNVPSPDTPVGPDESGNKVLRQVGEKPQFSFTPKPHWEIGESLGIIKSEKATEVSGSRFAYLMGDLVLMEFALLNLAMKILTDEEILKDIATRAGLNVSTKPFIPVIPPFMMRSAVMNRMARLDPIDERYSLKKMT